MPDIALIIALIISAAMFCQWLAWRVQLPAILFLLLAGIVAGPITGLLSPDALFADLLMPVVSLSVAIILFEGSLTLNFHEIKEVSKVVQRMISIGAITTWFISATAAHFLLNFSWEISALFGAIVIVTGPTVILPMLRTIRPTRRIANILRWEGIAIDPIGALMAVMTYEFILASVEHPALGYVFGLFLQTMLIGSVIGAAAGYILGQVLKRQLLPEYLHTLATLSLVLFTFTLSNHLQHESGLLAVTIMGVWLANTRNVDIYHILNFKENLSVLLISVLFIVLAARIDLTQLMNLGWNAILVLLVLQFIARPVKILLSTIGLDIKWQEKALLSWIAPRGIVAAAISAIFAERLVAIGYEEASYLVALTFSIIIGTVVLQSATARPIARWLGVAEPAPTGFLIVGANALARTIAKALKEHEYRCVLADSNWDNISEARMEGLETFYGNPVSQHADLHLDLSGIGNLLGLSPQRDANVIAAIHFRADFGQGNIFNLATSSELAKTEKHAVGENYKGAQLFNEKITYSKLASYIAKGYETRSTTLSDNYIWEQYLAERGESVIPLFVIDNKKRVKPFVAGKQLKPVSGWIIISLCSPE